VIVPSQRGVPPTANMHPDEAADGATVHGLAPPPGLVALNRGGPPPGTPPPGIPQPEVLTAYGEISKFMKPTSSIVVLAVGGGIALLATIGLIIAIVMVARSDDKKPETGGTVEEPIDTGGTAPTAPPSAPPSRTSPPRFPPRR